MKIGQALFIQIVNHYNKGILDLNILLVGDGAQNIAFYNLIKKSRFLDKVFTASKSTTIEKIPNIDYLDINDLVNKSKILKVDIIIVTDKNLVQQDIARIFKKNHLNVICTNQKWYNLENSRLILKKLLSYYSINVPQTIKVPTTFPTLIKSDLKKSNQNEKIIRNMEELLIQKNILAVENQDSIIFLEEFLEGEKISITSLWDGKNLFFEPLSVNLTEVQEDRLNLYKTKLNILLSDEKADFIGFLTSNLIWAKNDWYVLDYKLIPENKDIENFAQNLKIDFLYLLNSTIYQKLNEIQED